MSRKYEYNLDPDYVEVNNLIFKKQKRTSIMIGGYCSGCDMKNVRDGCIKANRKWRCDDGIYYVEVDPLYQDFLKVKEMADGTDTDKKRNRKSH
jgi:hypothetical protein